MLLTTTEREFLAVFIHEATTDPFKGPATEELHRRDIYYSDLGHLMAAHYLENRGTSEGFGGRPLTTPPTCPWRDRQAAAARDHVVEMELEQMSQHAS